MGNYQIAEHLLKSAVETLQNKQHPRAYLALENLVNNYKTQGKYSTWGLQNYEALLVKTARKYLPSDAQFIEKLFIQELFKPKGIFPEVILTASFCRLSTLIMLMCKRTNI